MRRLVQEASGRGLGRRNDWRGARCGYRVSMVGALARHGLPAALRPALRDPFSDEDGVRVIDLGSGLDLAVSSEPAGYVYDAAETGARAAVGPTR
jgi:hypothetical protein